MSLNNFHTMSAAMRLASFLYGIPQLSNFQFMPTHALLYQLRRSIFSIRARNLLEKETTVNKILR